MFTSHPLPRPNFFQNRSLCQFVKNIYLLSYPPQTRPLPPPPAQKCFCKFGVFVKKFTYPAPPPPPKTYIFDLDSLSIWQKSFTPSTPPTPHTHTAAPKKCFFFFSDFLKKYSYSPSQSSFRSLNRTADSKSCLWTTILVILINYRIDCLIKIKNLHITN